ncbi:type I-C CRISPR-associated protein Cas8c/Csd1 [Acidiphilium sp. AL]|uniref:Type I-C CRISPR-associated protein Cas8c/Csd1 n=1 Tax=Acidiphilium iwatense TaxID=768198 RepID=A0ABS9DWJ4_9PROT|nr:MULTISPECIES: type I-C CRISPR-associated protein Cas8c/Csd1 [Acidiphilium]MCF3947107.1 type I-C CRISPR-associated protein Cas8c/Csd1 [Acidiphilium iwatense]MCU4160590.1 type I-C CRISPR-associated protein Cas8c/Csd1 [Acidiphilium sp. AL]
MTVLQALNHYYVRMAERGDAEPPGYSRKSIEVCVWLNPDGSIAKVDDLNDYSGKKPQPRRLSVPQEVIRTSGISSNFLWDKTAYTLGVGRDKDKKAIRFFEKEHAEFVRLHRERLVGSDDAGLCALLAFLNTWKPEDFEGDARFLPDMLDRNVVFGLTGGKLEYLHERPAAQRLIEEPGEVWKTGICLVTGEERPIERLHPAIQGVDGAQSSGARLVSYNADAFTSYSADSGANAPTSVQAAFRYGTALNRLLDRGSSNRLKIGDTTIAFWADAQGFGEEAAAAAEMAMAMGMEPPDDPSEATKLRDALVDIRAGRPPSAFPGLQSGTRFYILGLAPNAARLAVRFWLVDTFGNFFARLAKHFEALNIEPAPWNRPPSIRYLLVRTTALQEKPENVPPLLAGETARAVLAGHPYPRTLLTAVIMRLRAGDSLSGWHAAVIKACINQSVSEKEKLPVALNPESRDQAYQLGRLFAVLVGAQKEALGKVNASIADRYYGAASATPARVFGPLLRNARNHISDAQKRNKGWWIERRLEEIFSHLDPALPKTLTLEAQGRFAVGYYHERAPRSQSEAAQQEEGDNK